MGAIAVQVKEARQVTPAIRELVLVSASGEALPTWEPGAHVEIDVTLPDGSVELRAYSLLGGTEMVDDPADTYRIAVERKIESRGGSHYLCDTVAVGDTLTLSPPKNEFQLHYHTADRVLVAGGIGVAPIFAMVRVLVRRGVPFQLHYAGPDPAEMAYRAELENLAGSNAHFHFEGGQVDLEPVFEALGYPAEIYLCGQRPLTQSLSAMALDHGLSRMQIMQQCFDPPPPPVPSDNIGFEVELRQTGMTVHVPPETSILETLISEGYHAQFYCGRGECGFCPLPVLEADGPIVHRDHYLKPEERDEQMCICVSRLKSGSKIVLDA
jgi:vanillate O-demethylase ferredoxin subunit